MRLTKSIAVLLGLGLLLTACGPYVTTAIQPTSTPATYIKIVTNSTEATSTVLPTAATAVTQMTEVPATAVATTAAETVAVNIPDTSTNTYLDDLSTPAALILSYVNAINRHEYLRAYSYWVSPSSYIGSLDAFTNSLTNTSSESVTFGQITSDGAAGSIYYTVPAVMVDTMNGGGTNKFASCFIVRLPQPGNYGEPPIQPMNIDRGGKTAVSASTSNANALASACSGSDYPAGGNPETAAVEPTNNLTSSNYIDNRSGAIELVSSLMNALNRKEYVRAYSYWQNPSTSIGTYDSYAAGFADTGSVSAVFGTVTSDVGAGQYHYQVPLAMKVVTTGNAQQTFVGCYTLHLSNPGMQATQPFEPLGITAGKFKQVSNGTDVTSLLTTVCN